VRITVKQRGGFAGIEATVAQVDTSSLDPAAREEVERSVREALSAAAAQEPPIGRDQLEYEITADEDGARNVKTWVDDGTSASAPVRELVAKLSNVR
jgi:hypothetical protein